MAFRDSFRPLRVRAHLRTAVITDQWLPLDGILVYQATRQQYGSRSSTMAGQLRPGEEVRAGAPLLIHNPDRPDWYYACSWAQWPTHVTEGIDHWNKRFDASLASLVDFNDRRGKVIVEQGRYKAYHVPVFYRAALWIEWYCVGDRVDVEALLSTVTHVGKKASQGWGRVWRWEVAETGADWSVWRNNRLMRGIPAPEATIPGRTFNLTWHGLRPPYWLKDNQALLAMP